MFGSSSCTQWLPTELVHTQMIYVWLYVSFCNHQNRATLFTLFFFIQKLYSHTHLQKKFEFHQQICRSMYQINPPEIISLLYTTLWHHNYSNHVPEFPRQARLTVFFFSIDWISTLILKTDVFLEFLDGSVS